MKDVIKQWFEWFQKADIEATKEHPPIVQPPTDEDDCVILRPNFDFRGYPEIPDDPEGRN